MDGQGMVNTIFTDKTTLLKKPILTWSTIGLLWLDFILYLGMGMENYLGYVPAEYISKGYLWGIVTNIFIHASILHLAANTLFFLFVSSIFERVMKWHNWLMFILLSALIINGLQFLIFKEVVIGISGVIYAMLGYLWACRKYYRTLNPSVVNELLGIFVVIAILGLLMTFVGIKFGGNFEHFGGLVLGALFGFVVRWIGKMRDKQQ